MNYNKLGNTDISVSEICLGTMTFGQQNSEHEGHEQLDFALANGVNFIDTAELYSIPPKAETYGVTEQIIGSWLTQRQNRDDIVLATKIAGPGGEWVNHIRGGNTRYTNDFIAQSLNDSLRRLRTDYVDLYQLHWPERNTNYFGRLGFEVNSEEENLTSIVDTLTALETQVKAGKIRHIGLSNETPWGMMQFITTAKAMNLPLCVSVQNPFSLLNRTYEVGCAEISHREQVGLLAYSPLGFGVLSGKYLNEQPDNARLTLWPHYSRYSSKNAVEATTAYVNLAKEFNLDPAQMALAFVSSRPFVTANIIGATSLTQLESNINSQNITLSSEVMEKINAIHTRHSNPAP